MLEDNFRSMSGSWHEDVPEDVGDMVVVLVVWY
jgi:hypothetical protein